ncbi:MULTISPECIES: hypothetical protein [Salipaludibacillus]|uniref:hypothetical protein n=1 Tax=Salipaludibacillus TaxID=1884449 RepID=UPI0015FEBE03|nr:hypothetical protein [Salipaludibacillus neizhouensis]
MKLLIGVIIFSIVALSVYGLLFRFTTDWPVEVMVICSLLLGGAAEWLFFKMNRES